MTESGEPQQQDQQSTTDSPEPADSDQPRAAAYGYVNSSTLVVFDRIQTYMELEAWAHHEGLHVEKLFVQLHRGEFEPFDSLIARLTQDRERKQSRQVIVPSLNDLSRCETLQAHMRAQIEHASDSPVRIVHERNRDRMPAVPPPLLPGEATDHHQGLGRKSRYSCDWCHQPKRWPDRCMEMPRHTPEEDDPCTTTIVAQCRRGDHRRCLARTCAHAARWLEAVRRAGIAATRATGTRWAVVSTIRNEDVEVIGAGNDFKRARQAAEHVHNQVYSAMSGPLKHPVYIVRGCDGSLF